MIIHRWYPVSTLQNRVDSIFEEFARKQSGASESAAARFVPAVDIYEDEHKIVVKLEVPGVKQDEIDVRIENDTLTVRGERKFEKEEDAQNFQRIERRYGTFSRAFTLPTTVDSESVSAQYDAGVLKVELNKRAETKPKQIKVGVRAAPVVQAAEAPSETTEAVNSAA